MEDRYRVSRAHRNLLVTAAAAAVLLISLGGIVCSTNSSGGCPDWPRCQGRLVPPLQVNAILEYTHRVVALLTTALVAAAAVVGWRRPESGTALRLLPVIAIVFIIAVAVFGAFAVLTGLPPLLAAIDLGSALVVLTLVVAAAVIAGVRHAQPQPTRRSQSAPAARLAVITLAVFFAVMVSGVLLARGTVMRCVGGPLHIGTWISISDGQWPYTLRDLFGVAGVLLAGALLVTILRDREIDSATRGWSILFGALFMAECLSNAAMISVGATALLLIISVVAAAGSWTALVVVAVRTRMPVLTGELGTELGNAVPA